MDDCTAEMLSRCGRAKGVTGVKTALSEDMNSAGNDAFLPKVIK